MITILSFILVIGVVVFIHELGHYLAARSVGMRVEKFSVGFPPRFLSFTSIPQGWDFKIFFYNYFKTVYFVNQKIFFSLNKPPFYIRFETFKYSGSLDKSIIKSICSQET